MAQPGWNRYNRFFFFFLQHMFPVLQMRHNMQFSPTLAQEKHIQSSILRVPKLKD